MSYEKLTAGNEKWSGSVDQDGVHLRDLTDMMNEPTEITSPSQRGSAAYKKASKVWEQVKACQTMREASDLLEAAGCKLHGFCAVD